ncbi:lysophospholipid acyltransferase family protein [Sandarakinorhabdus sp.]|uniref:lysophospholipid acyltransferase family protein n=1 Tax=Sandarakinorhabdus sp. TaxID=1916663 RepID=UPI003340DA9F
MTDRKKLWLSRRLEGMLLRFYRAQGWQAVSHGSIPKKAIIIAAPHTSNWDFLYFIGLTRDLGIAPSFMAKRQLFQWPLGRFMRDMGGVAINREAGGNYVQAMIDEFARRDEFLLTIAPEGTRSSVAQWRTGFYHIAMGAGVPLIVGMMDYAKKMGGLAQAFMPSGDYAADMMRIEEFYHNTTPRHPHKAMQSILAASEKPYARAA